MKISIIGTRGIPANYSGFETSVEETAWRLVERGHQVTVYCRSNHIEYDDATYRGVELVKLSSIKSKFLDTPTHTTLSSFHLVQNPPDVIQVYGVGNALWLPLLRMARRPIVIVVDGLDWRRAKWQGFAKWFLRQSENWAVAWADSYVVDSEAVVKYYKERFDKPPVYIAYGANILTTSENVDMLKTYGLIPNGYILFVGRLVPEKGVHYLIDAYNQLETDLPLVIVGDNIHDQEYVQSLKKASGEGVKFLGFVYGEGYNQLNSHAYVYVQPSDLEGTSPALLGAMGHGNCVLVSNIPENLETIGNAGVSFEKSNPVDLARKLRYLIDNPGTVSDYKQKAQLRIQTTYNWDTITEQYERLFRSLSKQEL